VDDVEAEAGRFEKARLDALGQIAALSDEVAGKIGEENAAVFKAHMMILDDEEFYEPMVETIRSGKVNAEHAVDVAARGMIAAFEAMEDAGLCARAADIRDVCDRLVATLSGAGQGSRDFPDGDGPLILAADDFSPSETVRLDRARVCALVSARGAVDSHSAIFARTMGIPAVVGLGDGLCEDLSGMDAAIDGDAGTLFVGPTAEVLRGLDAKTEAETPEPAGAGSPACGMGVLANIGSADDARAAMASGADGVGLFRSEFLFLGRDWLPDEDEQYASFREVLEIMEGKRVVIRTLDAGADKRAECLGLPAEENPALGMRATRLCLSRPDLFRTHLRAIYRASVHGDAAIKFPMIGSPAELGRAKEAAREARESLVRDGIPFREIPIGVMIETPAAAVTGDLLARDADFFSIGTNDLTQYALAIDRQNGSLDEFRDAGREAVMRLIRMTAAHARAAGIRCGICGTLASDASLTAAFAGMGIDSLSVEPGAIPRIRAVRG